FEDLPEIRLAEPAVDVLARFHRHDRRHRARPRDARREPGLAEATLAEKALDPVLQLRLRARDDLLGKKERLPARRANGRRHRERRGSGDIGRRGPGGVHATSGSESTEGQCERHEKVFSSSRTGVNLRDVQTSLAYNRWANRRLLKAAADLTPEELD